MFKQPMRVISNGKRIALGTQSHIIGNHLSTFISTDFKLFKLCQTSIYGIDGFDLISSEEEFNRIQEFFKELFYVCFSDLFLLKQGAKPERLKQISKIFTSQRRYLYFLKIHRDEIKNLDMYYKNELDWYDSNWRSFSSLQYDYVSKLANMFDNPNSLDIKFISVLQSDPEYFEYVTINNFQSFLFYEFNKILQLNIPITQCKNCNNYFAPEGRPDSLYCSNFYKDTGKTCQDLGASITYKEKINKNDIHKIFNRFYKKMYARIGKTISQEYFLRWSDLARKERDKAIENGLSADKFTNIINGLEG